MKLKDAAVRPAMVLFLSMFSIMGVRLAVADIVSYSQSDCAPSWVSHYAQTMNEDEDDWLIWRQMSVQMHVQGTNPYYNVNFDTTTSPVPVDDIMENLVQYYADTGVGSGGEHSEDSTHRKWDTSFNPPITWYGKGMCYVP